jgi:hypothetical protein
MDTENTTLDHANDSILASWNEIREVSTPEVKEDPGTFDANTGEEVKTEKSETRPRDQSGKFAKAQIGVDQREGVIEPVAETPTEAEPAAPEVQAVESPKSLRKELAEKHWGKLDPEIQAAWNARDQDYERGISRYRERAEAADRLESAFAPYRETLAQVQATPEQAISTLLGMDHILRTGQPQEKAALIAQLTRQFNVPIEEVSQVGPLQQQLLHQSQQLHAIESQQKRERAQQAQSQLDTLTSEVVKFSEGKEHFNTVSNEVFALIPQINQQYPNATPAEKLQKAYDIAVAANPTARAAMEAQRQEQARAEALRKATEAKKAAAPNRTPRGVVAVQGNQGSMEDTIRANAQKLGLA